MKCPSVCHVPFTKYQFTIRPKLNFLINPYHFKIAICSANIYKLAMTVCSQFNESSPVYPFQSMADVNDYR